ncbi:putative HTH-type transcriptional regulator YfiR [compost metagenome]
MADKPRSYDAVQTREGIISHAKVLFSKKGYGGVSISDICRAAGCSKGSIYHHFNSKEDLFIQLARSAFESSWDDWDKRSAGYASASDKVHAYAEQFARHANLSLTKAGEDFISSLPAGSEALESFTEILTGYVKRFERLIEEGIDSGEFKSSNAAETAFILLSCYSGLAGNVRMMDKEEAVKLYRTAAGILLDGIRQ